MEPFRDTVINYNRDSILNFTSKSLIIALDCDKR